MREASLDGQSAGTPHAGLVHDHHKLVAPLDDLLRFNPEAVKALEPAAEEALETVPSAMRAAFEAGGGLVPLDLRIEQLKDDREVTAVEGRIAAPECLDVRVAHACAVHHDIMSGQMGSLHFVKTHLPPAPARVLEVGCGDGRLARAVDDLGYRVTAIDPGAPEGAIFQRVALEHFADPVEFDAVIASRVLHHIHDLGAALSMLQRLLVSGGRLIVVENAFDRFDAPTARWYLEQRRTTDSGAPSSLQACLAEWNDDHAGLHGYAAMRRELDGRFTESYFAWTPNLHHELGHALEQEERTLIDAGAIQATGFVYVGVSDEFGATRGS